MNLIEKWKNRETKKSLKEENIQLQERVRCLEERVKNDFRIQRSPNFIRQERNIQKVQAKFLVENDNPYRTEIPSEIIKRQIAEEMVQGLESVIEYNFEDDKLGIIYTGTLYVATGDVEFR